MKSLVVILTYFILFVFFFLLFSLVGTLWTSYGVVIGNGNWIAIYCCLIGWWIALIPTIEIHDKYLK